MKIYITSVFESRPRIRPYRDKLWELGHEITASWLDESKKPSGMELLIFWKKLAIKDLSEIRAAECFILDTLEDSPRGGKEAEFGAAVSAVQPKFVYLVGPRKNVFHYLVDQQFDTWKECIAYVAKVHTLSHT